MEVEVHVKTESPRVAHMRPDGYTLGIGLAGALPPCRTWWQGQTDLGILDPTTSLATVRAGLVKAFTVTAATHPASAADIPTVDEVGLPGFYASLWHGRWGPMRPLPCHASSTARA
jgi:Tripartite tricarboxylate transporter family receptor